MSLGHRGRDVHDGLNDSPSFLMKFAFIGKSVAQLGMSKVALALGEEKA